MMTTEFAISLLHGILNTAKFYIPTWILGSVLGIALSFVAWSFPARYSLWLYFSLTGISFVPVTILIPYGIRLFGLHIFVFPLLALPVLLITLASSYEAFQHANRHRLTLLKNYNMPKFAFFWRVVLRESMPSMETTARQTLSLCFAIFLALDYYIEYTKGLGKLAHWYYDRIAFDAANELFLSLTIVFTGCIGGLQVFLTNRLFSRWTEFRRHY
jgi:ABC-type nitrate/sulfonate/bicarbonate transport system permease component